MEKPLSTVSVNNLLKGWSGNALTLSVSEYFTSHSLRRGLVTETARLGYSMVDMRKQGGWKTEKSVLRYVDEGDRFEDNIVWGIYSADQK